MPIRACCEICCSTSEGNILLYTVGMQAIRIGKPLEWDAERNQFAHHPDANKYLREAYHNGWSLDAAN